ncbi:MAG: hypothetical protein K6F05_04100 [Succinivibrio sp.]|nr:hypothetical protein [Succinivibrio sp.]
MFNSIKQLSHGLITDADVKEISAEPPLDMVRARRQEAHTAYEEILSQQQQRRQDYVKAIRARDLVSERYTFASVIHDDANSAALGAALGLCASLVGHKKVSENPPLLLIQGNPGSGKTVLCSCAVNYILSGSQTLTVRLVSFAALKKTQLHANDEDFESIRQKREIWQDFLQVDLLLIDNFLQDNKGLSTYEQQYLTELLNIRRQTDKALCITTSLDLSYLRDAVGPGCYEALRSYSVMAEQLLGQSRNQDILLHGRAL